MTDLADCAPFFAAQVTPAERGSLRLVRLAGLHRDRLRAYAGPKAISLLPAAGLALSEAAVGDWGLATADETRLIRILARQNVLNRSATQRGGGLQLIAANIDNLLITTSCNADFNPARLERYLSLAHQAGISPVIVITKADQTDDPQHFVQAATALGQDLPVIALDALGDDLCDKLAPWCGPGRTVALTGSSGVGKTTIANALTGGSAATAAIRAADAKGRHTTTARALHPMRSGGWLIDTPGMRSLGLAESGAGIALTFAEITAAATACRFTDCAHEQEPGCAVQAAIAAGRIDPARLQRYRKLLAENAAAAQPVTRKKDRAGAARQPRRVDR